MGTLSVIASKVRIRIREKNVQFFSDADLISLANDLLDSFYDDLRDRECKRVFTTDTLTLTEGTAEYALSDKDSIAFNSVLTDGHVEIPRYNEAYPDNLSYEETSIGIKFYNHTDQTVYVSYWTSRPSSLTAITDSTPWNGDWDQALMWGLVLETKLTRQFRISETAVMAYRTRAAALARDIEKYGTVSRQIRGNYA